MWYYTFFFSVFKVENQYAKISTGTYAQNFNQVFNLWIAWGCLLPWTEDKMGNVAEYNEKCLRHLDINLSNGKKITFFMTMYSFNKSVVFVLCSSKDTRCYILAQKELIVCVCECVYVCMHIHVERWWECT